MNKVVTWQTPSGDCINITQEQEAELRVVGKWPKNHLGQEYCKVHYGLHIGEPSDLSQWLTKEVA